MLPTRSPFARLWHSASRVRSPIASRSHLAYGGHDVQRQAAGDRAGIERFGNRYQGCSAALKALQQRAQILHAPGEPVERGDDDRLDFACVNQCQYPLAGSGHCDHRQ